MFYIICRTPADSTTSLRHRPLRNPSQRWYCMSPLPSLEAAVVGLVQGVSELFPVSSLGHNVLIPALVGGSWEADLNVSKAESPYLAFIVGLHVATALALLVYFRRDWVRIIGGFLSSVPERRGDTRPQRAGWVCVFGAPP